MVLARLKELERRKAARKGAKVAAKAATKVALNRYGSRTSGGEPMLATVARHQDVSRLQQRICPLKC